MFTYNGVEHAGTWGQKNYGNAGRGNILLDYRGVVVAGVVEQEYRAFRVRNPAF